MSVFPEPAVSLSVAVGKYRRQTHTHTHIRDSSHLLPLISPKPFLNGLYWQWDKFWQSTHITKILLMCTLQTQCPLSFSPALSIVLTHFSSSSLCVSRISTLSDSAVSPISFPQSVSFPVFISASHSALPQQLSQTADRQDITMEK